MGVNCSESALKAMSNVVQNDGLAVIHTVDGIWKVKHFPIAVVHARQRPLSLLERFVLKALIQVQGCTVEDLVAQFGLERGLVESTLRVIKHCNLIDLEVVGDESDEQRTRRFILEAELKTVLDTLAHSSGTGEHQQERKDLEAKKLVLQDQIREMTQKINDHMDQEARQQRFSVNLTGKVAHSNGYLKEPVEMKTYSFVRCLTSGRLFMMGNANLPLNALEEGWEREPEINHPDWTNFVNKNHTSSSPNQMEVETALAEAYPNDTIQINSIEVLPEKYLEGEAHIPIHLTLALNIAEKSPEVRVHLARNELQKLTWMDELMSQPKNMKSFVKHVSQALPKPTGASAPVAAAYPLARLDRMLANEISQEGMLVSFKAEQLTDNIDLEMMNLDRLLANRTSICLDSKMKKGYTFNDQTDDYPTSITVPAKTAGMGKGSLAVQSGYAETGTLTLNVDGGESFTLPVLTFSPERGEKITVKIDAYLRDTLSPKHCFLMSSHESDLKAWIGEAVAGLSPGNAPKLLEMFRTLAGEIYERANPTGHPSIEACFTSLLDHHQTTLIEANLLPEVLKLVEKMPANEAEKQNVWRHVERVLHHQTIETSAGKGNESEIFRLWTQVRKRTLNIPWEDMANLEHSIVDSCTMTRFEVNRHLEDKVKELSLGANLPLGHLADMLDRLIQRNIISKELNKKLKKFKAFRNIFTHKRDLDATLDITLESISVLRLLDTLNPDTKDKRYEASDESRQFNWNFTPEALTAYLAKLNMHCNAFKPPHLLDQELWLDAAINRLPLAYTEHPAEILTLLSEVNSSPHDLNTEHMAKKVVETACRNLAEQLPPATMYTVDEGAEELLMLLTQHQLGSEAKTLVKKRLAEVPYPASATALFDEIASSASVTKYLPDSEVRIRWKRSIEQSSFDSDYEQLERAGEQHMDAMPKDLQKLLLKPIIQRQIDVGLPLKTLAANIVELSEFMTHHPQWEKAVNGLENFTAERIIHVLKNQDSRDKWLTDLLENELKSTPLTLLKMRLTKHLKDRAAKQAKKAEKESTSSETKGKSTPSQKKGKGKKK